MKKWWQGRNLDPSWTIGAPLPLARLETATADVNGKLYICGGFLKSLRTTNRVDAYDPATDTWQRVADLPLPLTHANAAVEQHYIWIAGGFVGDHPGPVTDRVWRFDTLKNQWSEGIPLPKPRGGGGLRCVGRSLFYFGGYAKDRDTTCEDCWELQLDGEATWLPRSPFPKPRGHVASVVVNGQIYAMGGQYRHDTKPKDLTAVHVYDPAQDQWRQLADLPEPRSHFEPGTFSVNNTIVIVGGQDRCLPRPAHINSQNLLYRINRKLNDLYYAYQILPKITAYDISNDCWSELSELPEALLAPASRFLDGKLVVAGGGTGSGYHPRCRTLLNQSLLEVILESD